MHKISTSDDDLIVKGLFRKRSPVKRLPKSMIRVGDINAINFTGNDYFEISQDISVKVAISDAILKYGFGSGASAVVTGYTHEHKRFEDSFSNYMNRDASILFNTGYQANLAVMQCFGNKETTILADKYIHASIIDGVKLSDSRFLRYKHQSLNHAQIRLSSVKTEKCILVTESIFGMEGTITNLKEFSVLAHNYNASFFIDNAHGLGIIDPTHDPYSRARLIISPLGKAIGGMGAVVSGNYKDIETLIQFARSYRFSTSMPAAMATALCQALHVLEKDHKKFDMLMENINYFNCLCLNKNIKLVSNDLTPIRAVLVNDNLKIMEIHKQLLSQGFNVSPIRPNTVPTGQSRLRITITSGHTKSQISSLINALEYLL